MTDSTPIEESAGLEAPGPEIAPEPTADDLDSILNESIEATYKDEEPQGPVRDERGRFTSKQGDETPEEAPPLEASVEGDDQAEVEAETPEVPPLEAPQHWSAADKERFTAMPREAQEWAIERDKAMTADYTRKTQEIAQSRQQLEPLTQVLGPLRPALQQAGVTEADYIGRLIAADRALQTNPAAAIRHLAQQAGIELESLEHAEPVSDPQLIALQQQVESLQGYLSQAEQRSAQERQTELQGRLASFAGESDADGNLKHPHFEKLRTTMGQIIQAGAAEDLESAYQKALRLDDELYQQTIEAERQKVAEAEEKRRQEAIEKAKKVPARRSANPPGGSTTATDLDSILSQQLDAAGL